MRIKFYGLAAAVVATGFFAVGSAQSALVTAAPQQLKLDRSAMVVQVNGQAYRKRSRLQRYYRHKRLPAGQYGYSYGSYPFHSFYGMRAWYPPIATFDYPLLW